MTPTSLYVSISEDILTCTMSRLIFRNLPPSLTSESFKSTLSSPPSLSNANVTDTKLVPKRRFAFVGYKTAEDAQKVKDWFDGSFAFGGGKVQVELVKDETLFQPLSKKKTSSSTSRPTTSSNGIEVNPAAGPSKRLQEFMDVMKGADPTKASESGIAGPSKEPKKSQKDRKGKEKADISADEDDEAAGDDDDAAWLEKRRKAALADGAEHASDAAVDTTQYSSDEQLVLGTGRLFVRNLAFVTTEADLRSHFSTFGPLEEVHLPVSNQTGSPLGTAFILFRDPSDALGAYKTLDKTTFQGRLLHVLPGRAKPGQEVNMDGVLDGKVLGKVNTGKGEVKKGIEAKRKEESARGVNWATLYMNSDAVAASVASRMGISKSELLNGDDANAAVKLALAETHVIEETKKYFEDEEIVLESFSPKVPRSQTTILVKNIPFGTTTLTLSDLFAPHGTIKKILLPPAGTLGVVEFEHSHEAGKAFKAVSYKRMGNSVLYLEKGPVGMFKDPKSIQTPQEKEAEERRQLAERVANGGAPPTADGDGAASAAAAAMRDAPAEDDEAGATLYLKNLSFSTTTERLSSMLATLPGFSFARVQTKPDAKREGGRMSMGYGFVGFKTKKEASKAMGGLQGFEVDGKQLEVKFAQRGADADTNDSRDAKGGGKGELKGSTKSTKLLVKNIPFEATKKDIRELFSAFGQIKSLRLPKKPTVASTGSQSTRGFAFLDFTTHAEAQRAMDALKHTHLLGRHLVIQWAKEEDGIDVSGLREKVGREWQGLQRDGEQERTKRRKFENAPGAGGDEDMDGLEA